MILNKHEIKQLYRSTARYYNLALWGYRLIGITQHRQRAIERLQLKAGDTVLDLGCGTGANFALLEEEVGPTGRIVGVDLSAAMLIQAKKKIDRAGWKNIELVEADIMEWVIPREAAGVISTFALEMVPEYDAVIHRVASTLVPGKRLSLLGLKHPERWPEWIIEVGVWLNKPFGVSRDYERFRPWESLQQYMSTVEYQELYLGAAYRCVGESRP